MNHCKTQSSIKRTSCQNQIENIQQYMKEGFTTRTTQKFNHKKHMISKINLTQRNAKEENQLFTSRTFTKQAKKLIEDKNNQNSFQIPQLSTRTQQFSELSLKLKKNLIIQSPIEKIKQKLNKILFDGLQAKKMTKNILNIAKQSNKNIRIQYQTMGEEYDLPQIKKIRQKRFQYMKQVRKMQDWMLYGLGLDQQKQKTQTLKSVKSFKSFKKKTLSTLNLKKLQKQNHQF